MLFGDDTPGTRRARAEPIRQHQPTLMLHNENPKPQAFRNMTFHKPESHYGGITYC